MIKIVFCDMDGTLLDDKGQLPPDFDEVMAELKKRGVIFAPASGRQYYALTHQLEKYKDEFAFLAENGSLCMYHDGEIYSNTVAPETLEKVLNEVKKLKGIYVGVCGKKDAYVLHEHSAMEPEARKFYTHMQLVDSYEGIDDEVLKVALCDLDGKDTKHNVLPYLKELEDIQQIVASGPIWVDIMNQDANKGNGVRAMLDHFGFKPEEAAAFGDYMNDCDMLKAVKYSYAMENALPAVKEQADFITKSNNEHGVTWQLKQLMKGGLI